MPHRLFLIHGMGKHETGWHEPIVASLRDIYGRYRVGKFVPFDERFRVVPLTYDDILRDLLRRWQEDAASIGPLAQGVGAGQVESLVGWLRDIDADDFAWSHAADALLYRLFFDVRQAVKTSVARQIVDELCELRAEESWSVLGYSLGSAVAHDALDLLWTGQLPDGLPNGFEPERLKAQLVMMIANVSRVLETTPDVYESTVRPGAADAPDRGCFHYLNVRHRLDPFTIPRMFAPLRWPDPQAIADGRYLSVEVRHIHQRNIHAWEHYLAHPAVHIPMLRRLTFERAVLQDEEALALASFDPFAGLGEEGGFEVQGALETLAPSLADRWSSLRAIWDRFQGFSSPAGGGA